MPAEDIVAVAERLLRGLVPGSSLVLPDGWTVEWIEEWPVRVTLTLADEGLYTTNPVSVPAWVEG